ncbi:peptidoglycan-binding protein [Candidatus Clostridium radicumherbarum]|uniref:Peptidoglycan-binding protein n=1 Tax=Candidatus Clostridium radicumherbarum TaxID=3381662 RepID=A0ABW8TMS0_9CLOT
MKKQNRIRGLSILLTFLFFLNSSSTVFAAAANTIASIPVKGEYYGKDINQNTDKVNVLPQDTSKAVKALRKPQVNKAQIKSNYSKDKEKLEKRTENSKTYKLDANHDVTEVYLDKIHYKDKNGNLQDIDNTLVGKGKSSTEYYENKANDFTTTLPALMDKDNGVTMSKDGYSLTLYPYEGDFSKSAVNENAILFNDVFEGIDYQYTVQNTSLKEDIILNHYVDKNEFKYYISAKGLTLKEESNTIAAYAKDNDKPLFIINAPIMTDAAGKVNTDLQIHLDKKLFGKDIITVTANKEWLQDKERAYPVKVDPDIEAITNIQSTHVEESNPSERYFGNGFLYVGNETGELSKVPGGLGHTQSYLKFPVNITQDKKIVSATLTLYRYTTGTDAARNIQLCSLDQPVDLVGMSWSNRPMEYTKVDTQSVSGNATKSSPQPVVWNITSLVQKWALGAPNNGVTIKTENDNDPPETFSGGVSNNWCQAAPYVEITSEYNNPVDTQTPLDSPKVNLRPLSRHTSDGLLALDGVFADGIAKPGSAVTYSLEDESQSYTGTVDAGYSYKYPNSDLLTGTPYSGSIYKDIVSNWQASNIFKGYSFNTLYSIKAVAELNGVSGAPGYSDSFQIYQVQAKDTIPYIANFYGVPAATIEKDNSVRDSLLIEGNTLFIRNPMKNQGKAYTPAPLSDEKKREIDSALMGRNKHCVYGFEPINLITGNFYYNAVDASASDYNGDFSIIRTYNAKGEPHDGYFGVKWDFNFNKSLSQLKDGTIIFNKGDGNANYYRPNGDGSYNGPVGDNLKLTLVQDEAMPSIGYKISDGLTTMLFNKIGLLASEADVKGNATKLTYDENYKLTSITTPSGKVFGIALDGQGRISTITLPDTNTLHYSYDDNGNLISFVDAKGGETKYFYDEKSRMTYFTDPKGNKVTSNVYDSEDRVVNQTDAEGKTITINYYDGYNEALDANGNKTQYYYDSSYRITKVVNPDGTVELTTYDDNNNVKTKTDALKHTTTFEYDSRGNKTKEIRFDGKVQSYQYDVMDNMTSITDYSGNTSTMTYDTKGNLLKLQKPENNSYSFNYNDNNQVSTMVNPEGKVTSYYYNGADLSKIVDAKGNAYKYYYNPMGKVISIEDPLGKITRMSYNESGQELSTLLPNGANLTYGYDINGNKTSITDGNKKVTAFEYDKLNRLFKVTDALGNLTQYFYDGNGNMIEELNPRGGKKQYEYDSLNRLVKVIDEGQGVTTYERDALGNIISSTDPTGNKSTFTYNYAVNKIEKAVGVLGQTLLHEYDAEGNLIKLTLPDGNVEQYKYDSLYRQTQFTDINGLITNTTYDPMGNVTQINDSLNRKYNYEYDENGNLIKTIDPLGYENNYTYDSRNSLISSKDAAGNVTNYSYTATGNLMQTTDALGNSKSYEYDLNGNLLSETSPNGYKKLYSYDALNRLISVKDPLNNLTQYTYDKAGNVDKIIDSQGNATSYEYTGTNLPSKVTDAIGNVLQMNYDKNGNVIQLVYPNGDSLSMTYDGENRLLSSTDPAGLKKSYEYDIMGKLTKQADNAGNEIQDSYDSFGRLIQQKDIMGRTIKYGYDLAGSIISKVDIDGNTTAYAYDKKNRVINITDPEGKITSLNYDGLDRLTQKQEPGDKKYTYEYDNIGNLIKTIDPLNNATGYKYDKDGNLTEVTNSKGSSKTYGYDALDRLTSFKDERGNINSFTYDGRGSLIKVQDAMGGITQFKYDALNRLQMKVDALGFDTQYQYDNLNNLTAVVDAKGNKTSYEYNKHGLTTNITDPLKGETQFQYDLNDMLIKQINPMGETYSYSYDKVHRIASITDPEGYMKSFNYSSLGNLEKEYDSAGNTTTYTYDKMHRLLSEQNTAGYVTSYSYDSIGNLNSVKEPNGNISLYEYDALDRVNKTVDPEGKATTFEYDSLGNIVKVVKPGSQEYKFTYDEANNLSSMVNPLGETTSYTYNKNNMLTTETNPMGSKTTYSYNALNMLTQVSNPLGYVTKYSYDKNKNLASVTDENNNKTSYDYDELNRLIKVTDPLNQETKYGYDKSSNLISVINGNGNETKYSYDKVGRVTSVTNPLGESESYSYNPIGTVASYMKPDGSKISYNYDILNRLVAKKYSDNSGQQLDNKTVSYKYDIMGNPIEMKGEEGTTSYQYDKLNRLQNVSFATGENVKYLYDELGRKSEIIYPDGKYVKYNYDGINRLNYVENWKGEKTYYSYDGAGRRVAAILPNGTKVSYIYDAANRLTKLVNSDKNGSPISTYEYTYDNAGNIVGEKLTCKENSYTRTYSYDASNEIIGFTEQEVDEDGTAQVKSYNYSYDKDGNRIAVSVKDGDSQNTTSYKYNEADELVSETKDGDGSIKYEYDKNGNRLRKIMPGQKIEYYEYDLENRLLQITNPSGEVLTFGYDSDGNRLFSTYGIYFKPQKGVEEDKPKDVDTSNGSEAGTAGTGTEVNMPSSTSKNNKAEAPSSKNNTPASTTKSNTALAANTNANSSNSEAKGSPIASANGAANNTAASENEQQKQSVNTKAPDKKASPEVKTENKSFIQKFVQTVKEGFIKFTSMVSQGIKKAAEAIANFFKQLFGVSKVKAKEMSFVYAEKLESSNGNGNSRSNGSDKDKSNNGNGNGNGSSGSNGNGNGNGNGNSNNNGNNGNGNGNSGNNGNGNGNGNHGSNNGNNGLHLGWYKRPDHPQNPGNQDPLDNTSNYEIINYVNDISLANPQVLMTSDKNGNYTEAYTYGLDRISADNLTADDSGKNNPLYYLYDGRGSVGQVINSSGEVKNSYSYDPFGVTDHDGPLGNSKAHYQDYFGFNGEEYNNISGLQYLRARYYEADSGRFLTRDSYMGNIMNPLSLNRYDYALNNPVMNIDPSGNMALAINDDGVAAASSYGMLRNGSSGKDVALLQTMLSAAGFNPGTIDGMFGNNTEKAVRAYQASKGLSVDGIVGNQTWGALRGVGTASSTASNSAALPMLKKGSTDTDTIKKLQKALIAQHYDLGPSGADGIFGNKTEQAVLNFQWSKNLSVDGIVGSQTWGALLGQSKACDGKDYIGSQGTGNSGHITQSTYNNTASADEIITIMSNRGYPITYTRGQWEIAGEIITAGAVLGTIASITDLYVAGGLTALKDKILSIFNKGAGEAVAEDTVIPYNEYENIYNSSLHNGFNSNDIMLGKYDGGSPTNYINQAKNLGYKYFDLGEDWGAVQQKYNLTDSDMFKLFNESFLDDGINSGSTFHFSQNPIGDTGALGEELNYLMQNGYKYDPSTMIANLIN